MFSCSRELKSIYSPFSILALGTGGRLISLLGPACDWLGAGVGGRSEGPPAPG